MAWPGRARPARDGEAAMVVVIGAGETGRGGERPVPDGEVAQAQAAHVVVNVADDRAATDQEQQGSGCRICHLPDADGDGEPPERLSGRLVRLGCGCRGELAAAHRRCAEAWFSVRGNRYVLLRSLLCLLATSVLGLPLQVCNKSTTSFVLPSPKYQSMKLICMRNWANCFQRSSQFRFLY